MVEMGDEELLSDGPDMQPSEARIKINLSLFRNAAEPLAGLLSKAESLNITTRATRGVTGADIVARLETLAGRRSMKPSWNPED
jgi:hypothetical protein